MLGTILKFVMILIAAWLMIAIFSASKVLKKQQAEMMENYQKKQKTFRHIDGELFDATSDEEIKDGIMVHIFDKEDEDFEHLKEHLTEGERVVYTLYQMEIAVDQGRGSVYQFFNSPSKEYLPYLKDSYLAVGSEKLAELMEKIMALVIQEQTGKQTKDELDMDEDAPTFQSYTYDYMDLTEAEQLNDKIVAYIRAHREDFLN